MSTGRYPAAILCPCFLVSRQLLQHISVEKRRFCRVLGAAVLPELPAEPAATHQHYGTENRHAILPPPALEGFELFLVVEMFRHTLLLM